MEVTKKSTSEKIIELITDEFGYPLSIAGDDIIYDMGIDSLDLSAILSRLEGIYCIRIDDSIFTNHSITVDGLSEYILNKVK